MPEIDVDFSDVEEFAALAEGIYTGHIEYVRFREAPSADKTDQLAVCLVVDEGESKGEKAWQNLYFSQKAMPRMAKFFALFGITAAKLKIDDDDPFDLLDPDLSGEPVTFEYRRDGSYKNKPSFKTEVLEWLGGNAKPLPTRAQRAQAEDPLPMEAEDAAEATETAPAKPAKQFGTKASTTAAASSGRRPLR